MQQRLHGDRRNVLILARLRSGNARHEQREQQRDQRKLTAQRRMRRETSRRAPEGTVSGIAPSR